MLHYKYEMKTAYKRARFGGTYTKIGTIQRRLAWPLRKDDTQNREAFHIFGAAPLPFEKICARAGARTLDR